MRRIALLLCLCLMIGALPAAAADTTSAELPDLDVIDPVRFSYDEAITSRHLIPGRNGLQTIAFDLIRPNTTAPVPTIMVSSPYYNTSGRYSYGADGKFVAHRKTPWGEPSRTVGPTTDFPEQYDEFYVPRGYAVLLHDLRGTRNSSGCQVYGHRSEAEDAVDVINWVAEQEWSNGAVGMIGGSYDGTIANGAASEAPEALKAIVPIRSIGRWYDYHHINGVMSSLHLLTPASFTTLRPAADDLQNSSGEDDLYGVHVVERKACAVSVGPTVQAQYTNPYADSGGSFWQDRDYLKDAGKITAATFLVHGLRDDNVKPTNASHLWDALPDTTPKKLWWLRGGHDNPHSPDLKFPVAAAFEEELHRWFAEFLKGLDVGALDTAPVVVQDEEGRLNPAGQWPVQGEDVELFLTHDGLTPDAPPASPVQVLTHTDTGTASIRLTYTVPEDLHISGQPYMSLRYSLPGGGDTTFAYLLTDLDTGDIVSRGYARGAFREQINARGASAPTAPAPHAPGAVNTIEFPFYPTDHVLPAGTTLQLTLRADDEIVHGGGNGSINILVGESKLVIPAGISRAAAADGL